MLLSGLLARDLFNAPRPTYGCVTPLGFALKCHASSLLSSKAALWKSRAIVVERGIITSSATSTSSSSARTCSSKSDAKRQPTPPPRASPAVQRVALLLASDTCMRPFVYETHADRGLPL